MEWPASFFSLLLCMRASLGPNNCQASQDIEEMGLGKEALRGKSQVGNDLCVGWGGLQI